MFTLRSISFDFFLFQKIFTNIKIKMTAEGQQLVVEICQKLHQRGEALIPGTGLALKQG